MTPAENPSLIGHEQAIVQITQAMQGGRMPHAWIIGGGRGLGKATLAYAFARAMLAGDAEIGTMPESHPVFRRVVAGSHADLLVVQPEYDAKKEQYKSDIGVETARGIAAHLALTPAESAWRVVIVDSADALNINAANAILKILEEPPARALLLLVAHNPGGLLPTIRSRCRSLTLAPLSPEACTRVMRRHHPEMTDAEFCALSVLSDYSPGVALEWYEQGALELYDQLAELIRTTPNKQPEAILKLAEQASGTKGHQPFKLLGFLYTQLLARALKAQLSPMEAINEKEAKAWSSLNNQYTPQALLARWQAAVEHFSVVQRLHLDYKTAIINEFTTGIAA